MSRLLDPATPTRHRHVLVVEDDAVNMAVLHLILKKIEYLVVPAPDVATARQKFKQHGPAFFDCVLTDHWLPDQTGLDLLRWLKVEDPSLATVMLTNDNNRDLITESLRLGLVDFLEKPVQAQKLQAALDKATLQTARQRHLHQSESALENLGRIQRWMIHSTNTQNIELCFHPVFEAGGDFLGHFQINPDSFCCLLTDVSGHDPQAAYVSSYFHGIFRGMAIQDASPVDIFQHFNRFLVHEWNQAEKLRDGNVGSTSIAAAALIINTRHQTALLLINGSPIPIQIHPDGRTRFIGENTGPPLGWFSDIEINASRHDIAGGGTICLWSDGLSELAHSEGIHPLCLAFALQRAKAHATRLPALKHARDDILFASIRLPGSLAADLFRPIILESYCGDQARDIDQMCSFWRRNLQFAFPDLTDASEHDILLASREAVLNALKHGCQNQADKIVHFQASYHPEGNLLRVWVEDPGPGHQFDVAAHANELDQQLIDQHRGLICIHHLAQSVHAERDGATLIMDFQL